MYAFSDSHTEEAVIINVSVTTYLLVKPNYWRVPKRAAIAYLIVLIALKLKPQTKPAKQPSRQLPYLFDTFKYAVAIIF